MPKLNPKLEQIQRLRDYMMSSDPEWVEIKQLAERKNAWFTQEFIQDAITAITANYLDPSKLESYADLLKDAQDPKLVGIIMAGNIPLVGFHDFLTVFLSPHHQKIKFSSKDDVLLSHLIRCLIHWFPELASRIQTSDMLKSCDAYITTGSRQSAQTFSYYFGKYPHIIRPNKTSVAILDGNENESELLALADDVYRFFGLGCRNVTHLFVPADYRFENLLHAFRKYDSLKDHNKYRNNLDYQLALYILNKQFYMCNDSILMIEHPGIFSPVSVLHYSFYSDLDQLKTECANHPDIQAITGKSFKAFGSLQKPELQDFADGIDTIHFLNSL